MTSADNLHMLPPNAHEWERQAQTLAEAHLEGCRAALYHEDEHSPYVTCEECPPQVASWPYDDCVTCVVRETIAAAWPALAELAVAEYISLVAGAKPSWRQ